MSDPVNPAAPTDADRRQPDLPGRGRVFWYVTAVVAVFLAWRLTLLIWPWLRPNVGPIFFVTVIAIAWYGGLGPALFATAMAGACMTYGVDNPMDPPGFGTGDAARLATFVMTTLLITWLNRARKHAQAALAESQRLRARLEDQHHHLQVANERLRAEVAERRAAQEETLAHQRTLRKLAAELSLTEERERREIASQLHDGVGQMLAFAQMRLETVRAAVADSLARGAFDEAIAQLKEAIAHTRLLTRELSPPVLYEAGLENAIEWLADNVRRRHGLDVSIDRHGPPAGPDALSRELRVFLFQTVRELLTNIVKHAKARQVHVNLYVQDGSIRVLVEDDGVGNMPDIETLRDGFGLLNIRERVRHLGGQIDVENDPGRGARVTVTVPTAHSDHDKGRDAA